MWIVRHYRQQEAKLSDPGYTNSSTVAVDIILTALHLLEGGHAGAPLIPILSAAVEMVLLGILAFNVRLAIQRTDFVSSFLHS